MLSIPWQRVLQVLAVIFIAISIAMAIAWYFYDPGFDPVMALLSVILAIVTSVGSIFAPTGEPRQSINGSNNTQQSTQYGNNINAPNGKVVAGGNVSEGQSVESPNLHKAQQITHEIPPQADSKSHNNGSQQSITGYNNVQQATQSGHNINAPNAQTVAVGDISIVQQVKEAQQIPHEIPSPPLDFTGRDAEIKELLKHFDRGAIIVGIRGMGGIGKTALAYKLAKELQDRYPDGQLMVDLRGTDPKPLTSAEAMAHVIRAYSPKVRLPESESDLSAAYRTALHNKRALLLLDNAANDRQVQPLLPSPPCGVLITSRKKFTLPGLKEKDLDKLTPLEAKQLLLAISGRIEDHADELAKLCGYLPLALRAAGSLLANTPDLKPVKYIEKLRAERTRLNGIGTEGVDRDVEASFNLSYDQLPENTARVFRILSVFPADFDAKAEEIVCEDKGHRYLSELVRWSLVDYRSIEGMGRYQLHDLARIFASNHLIGGDDRAGFEAYLRHAGYYRDVLSKANDLYEQGGENVLAGIELFDLEWLNIQAGQAWAEGIAMQASIRDANSEKKIVALWLCSDYPIAGRSLLYLRLHPHGRIQWLKTALYTAPKLNDREKEERIMNNMGLAYQELGKYRKAIAFHEQALIIARETKDRREEGANLGNLGNAYGELGEYRKAVEFHEQALTIAREIGNRWMEEHYLGNLGNVYNSLGEYRKAIELYEQAIALDREIEDRLGEGQDLSNLGNVYNSLGEYRKAIELYEQAIAIYREIGYQLGEGYALFNKSLVLDKIEERALAITCAKSALLILEQIKSPTAEKVRQLLAEWQD